MSDGQLRCWGSNAEGQLGNNSTQSTNQPGYVGGLADVVAVGLGQDHVCAVTETGKLHCWGRNNYGQLGYGTGESRLQPGPVVSIPEPVESTCGGSTHTCALANSGTVYCWGKNTDGQLGVGDNDDRLAPTPVSNLVGVKQLACGPQFTCAVVSDDSVVCWGSNSHGQLGNGNPGVSENTPAAVPNLQGVTHLTAAGIHTCALTGSSAWCWGSNFNGQLGDGTKVNKALPTQLTVVGPKAIVAGGGFTCVNAAQPKCWGVNSFGQLGNGNTDTQSGIVTVQGALGEVKQLAAGGSHVCAILADDRLACWGGNITGQLGDGTNENRSAPVIIAF